MYLNNLEIKYKITHLYFVVVVEYNIILYFVDIINTKNNNNEINNT
jgi:hypothetical protein